MNKVSRAVWSNIASKWSRLRLSGPLRFRVHALPGGSQQGLKTRRVGDWFHRPLSRSTPAETKKSEPGERTDDPVRMYLREMGSVELLSREGEIAIAKRIEAGREAMIAGLSRVSPPATSRKRSSHCSARTPAGSRPRPSEGSRTPGLTSTCAGAGAISPPSATSTSGPTASTCRPAWRTRPSACWSSSAPRRRARRARRPHRRRARECPILAGIAPRSKAARACVAPELAVADGALGFWQAIEEAAEDPRPALLGPQDRQRLEQVAEESALESQAGAARDLDGRNQEGCACGVRRLHRNLGGQIRQGGRMLDQGSRRAAGFLRLPRRALETSTNEQRHRKLVRDHPPPHGAIQGMS